MRLLGPKLMGDSFFKRMHEPQQQAASSQSLTVSGKISSASTETPVLAPYPLREAKLMELMSF